MIETFYRVLLTPDHLTRWRAGERHSFHGNTSHWWDVWRTKCSTDPNDYELGPFTAAAREAFLKFVQSGRERMTEAEQKEATEFDGVCAFDSPRAAFEYGGGSSPPAPTVYVQFEGIRKGPVPEDHGVVAEVVQPFGAEMSPAQFKRLFDLSD